jgi:hypothetical protein
MTTVAIQAAKDALKAMPAAQPAPVQTVAIPDNVRKIAKAMQKDGYRGPLSWARTVIDFVATYKSPPAAQPAPVQDGHIVELSYKHHKNNEGQHTKYHPLAAEPEWKQIAEDLRFHGLTLVKTATGYAVLKLGAVQAQATPPAAPVQSCYCSSCEALGKEIQALKSTNDRLLQAITKTVQENLHLADGDNCTLVHLVRALGPNDPGREAPLTREELRAMWIKRETGWDFYVNVDARLFGEGKAIDKLTGLDGKVVSEAIDCLENPKWFGWPKMETYTGRRKGIEVRFRNKEDHDKFFANCESFDLMQQNKTIFWDSVDPESGPWRGDIEDAIEGIGGNRDLNVGDEITLQRAIDAPDLRVRILSIPGEDSDAHERVQYEIINPPKDTNV